jgi:hypothetical protein
MIVKNLFDVAKDVLAVVGAGYVIHKIYAAVEYVEAKAKAVKAALVAPTTSATPAAATTVKK